MDCNVRGLGYNSPFNPFPECIVPVSGLAMLYFLFIGALLCLMNFGPKYIGYVTYCAISYVGEWINTNFVCDLCYEECRDKTRKTRMQPVCTSHHRAYEETAAVYLIREAVS